MLPFLARTFLLLAVAFGLGALGGRSVRPKARPPRRGRQAAPDAPPAAEHSGAQTSRDPGQEAIVSYPAVSTTDVRPPAEPVSERDTLETMDLPPAVGQPAFASYGSGFVAGVILSDLQTREGAAEAAPKEGTDPVLLAAPDIHGRTPTSEQRRTMREDPLDARHGIDPLDFRSVDYGNAKAAERTAAEASSRDDGWTIPEGASLPAHGSLDDSPAAFKSGGGSGAVFGAPETETDRHDVTEEEIAVREASAPAGSEMSTTGASATAPIAVAQNGAPDDLTRIHGIGPSLERLLFDHGVFRFDQIAGWTEVDMRWADALSGFEGRVARERWIEQAKTFLIEKPEG